MNPFKIFLAAAIALFFVVCTVAAFFAGRSQSPPTSRPVAVTPRESSPPSVPSRQGSDPQTAAPQINQTQDSDILPSPVAQQTSPQQNHRNFTPPVNPGASQSVSSVTANSSSKQANSPSVSSSNPVPSQTLSSPQSVPLIASPVSSGGGSTIQSEDTFVVPLGARLPAAFSDNATNLTPQQAIARDGIANDFMDSLPANEESTDTSPSANGDSSPDQGQGTGSSVPQGEWDSAATDADDRYRAMFGVEAYNAWSAASAKEALAETQ